MAYVDIATLQTIAAGQPLSAATVQQIRDNEEFLIDPPACSVFNNAAVSVASGVTLNALAANSENYDNDSMHSTSVNTSRITIQTAGRYEVGLVVSYAANATNNRNTQFRVNGTTDYVIDLRAGVASNTNSLSGNRTIDLDDGDYIEVVCWQNSGGNLDIQLIEFYALFRTR